MLSGEVAQDLMEPLAIVNAGMDKLLKLLPIAAVAIKRGGSTVITTVGRRFCTNLDLDYRC